jgi:hypothetical protein
VAGKNCLPAILLLFREKVVFLAAILILFREKVVFSSCDFGIISRKSCLFTRDFEPLFAKSFFLLAPQKNCRSTSTHVITRTPTEEKKDHDVKKSAPDERERERELKSVREERRDGQ